MLKQLILTVLLITSFNLFAQDGTSLEEYRYLSKGYVYQLEMGLDAQKEGYLIKNIFKTSKGIDLVGLYQIGNSEPRALLVVMDQGKEKANYFCIPNGTADQRVVDLAAAEHTNISAAMKNDFQSAVNEFLFAALSNPNIKTITAATHNSTPPYQRDENLASRSADLEQYIREAPQVKVIQPNTQSKTVSKLSKSSYHGDIANRMITLAEEAVNTSNKKGVVSIKICVDMDGNVVSTKFTQRGSTTFDTYLKKVALEAAKNIIFAKNDQAEQCGIVSYKF